MLYGWRYKARNLTHMAQKSYGGIQVTTAHWSKLQKMLERAFASRKGGSSVELDLSLPDEKVQYFAEYLVSYGLLSRGTGSRGDSSVFLKNLRLVYEPNLATPIALKMSENSCECALSENGLNLVMDGLKLLVDNADSELDEYPVMDNQDRLQCLRLHPYPTATPGLPR